MVILSRRARVVPLVLVLMAAAGPASAAVRATSGGTWGTFKEVPGIAALNAGGGARITSVSCASAGNCSAGGYYEDAAVHIQAFVVTEKNGTWGTAKEVPGIGKLNSGGSADIASVSCGSAGNCTAGGYYTQATGHVQAFVAGQKNGTWGTAIEVPGTARLNKDEFAEVTSVSCPSAGNCGVGGYYSHDQPFVVSEKNGTWGTAQQVPGIKALDLGGGAEVLSVSCPSAGNCGAGGVYQHGSSQAFVVSEKKGTWGPAKAVPGTVSLNKGRTAQVNSVSCASAGNCAAVGYYTDGSFHQQVFVVSQKNGTWQTAKETPGTASLNKGGTAQITSVSCGSAGNCSAVGSYTDRSLRTQVFVATEKNGTWQTAREAPGTASLNKGSTAQITSVSCASAGNCATGGSYTDGSGFQRGFVASQSGGNWGTALEVPGTAGLTKGGLVTITSVSCGSVAHCTAGGSYVNTDGLQEAFVVSET